MIADRILSPGSKLSCSVGMNPATAQNTLAEERQLGEVDVHELYDAMDWLLKRQPRIENKLAKKHLKDGTLMLFDVSSRFDTGKKSTDLHIRPIRHWNDDRIRAHVFLCMLAYYVESHMRDALRELIFDDADIAGAQASRKSVVAKAKRSSSAKENDATRRTPEGLPVQSFRDLLQDMATLCRHSIRFESSENVFHQLTESTPLQRHLLELLSANA